MARGIRSGERSTEPNAASVRERFMGCLERAKHERQPWSYWLLSDALPPATCEALRTLPIEPAAIDDTQGRRETNNATRVHFSPELQARFPVCRQIAEMLQDPATIARLERTCGTSLKGALLRIEYCQDQAGFWLEPHTDIGAKLFTMLIYLSDGPGSERWGTDIYDQQQRHVGTAPYKANAGLIFVPGSDTWHGFEPRSIDGVRRMIMVNYVKPEWRDRHQLAFPDRPVG